MPVHPSKADVNATPAEFFDDLEPLDDKTADLRNANERATAQRTSASTPKAAARQRSLASAAARHGAGAAATAASTRTECP